MTPSVNVPCLVVNVWVFLSYGYGCQSVDICSHTLPAMSCRPYGPPASGNIPTGVVSPTNMLWLQLSGVGGVSPHTYMRPSVPRAAFSHSASVGRRVPD